jgi:arylformamidase
MASESQRGEFAPMPTTMPTLVDLTIEQYEHNATHPAHGRGVISFQGTGSHAFTRQWKRKNPYDGSTIELANEYLLLTGHTGTHVDAPYHVDGASEISIERVPLERTMGPAVWLDLSGSAAPGTMIDVAQLEAAEAAGGEAIAPGDIVLIHTGWVDAFDARNNMQEHIEGAPSLTRAAGEWFRSRKIKALGVDLPSPDSHCARDLPIHMNFLRPASLGLPDDDYILIYENLVNVAKIPRRRFTFLGLPIPFRGATGSPIRAAALV